MHHCNIEMSVHQLKGVIKSINYKLYSMSLWKLFNVLSQNLSFFASYYFLNNAVCTCMCATVHVYMYEPCNDSVKFSQVATIFHLSM